MVPMIAQHTSGWKKHELLPPTSLFPADRVLDFMRMKECGMGVVAMNTTVTKFAESFADEFGGNRLRIVFHGKREYWTRFQLEMYLGGETRQLVYLRGADMFHKWFPARVMLPVRKCIRFSPWLRSKAVAMVRKGVNGGVFNAMHVRMGDYTWRWDGNTDYQRAKTVANKAASEGLDPKMPLYLASDEPNSPVFNELKRRYKVLTMRDLPRDLVQDYMNLFPPGRIRTDMFGVLDQLICAQAKSFVPTGWSTFSESITFIRGSKMRLFPEIDPAAAAVELPGGEQLQQQAADDDSVNFEDDSVEDQGEDDSVEDEGGDVFADNDDSPDENDSVDFVDDADAS